VHGMSRSRLRCQRRFPGGRAVLCVWARYFGADGSRDCWSWEI